MRINYLLLVLFFLLVALLPGLLSFKRPGRSTALTIVPPKSVLVPRQHPPQLNLILPSSGVSFDVALPEGSCVASVDEATNVSSPFILRKDKRAAKGVCLQLPEGAGSNARDAQANISCVLEESGNYNSWARVFWRDSCSNSLRIKIGDHLARDIGNDHIYNSWHWVNCGTYQLKKGNVPVVLQEREDGIAMDQVFLTLDSEFRPSGILQARQGMIVPRQFADTFTRSPGHGMEAWDLTPDAWEIAFSLDPNRIPNQYTLKGHSKGGMPAKALFKESAWKGCQLEFSFYPEVGSEAGAVIDWREGEAEQVRILFRVDASASVLSIQGKELKADVPVGELMRLKQWHRISIERWAWVLRIFIDDHEVYSCFTMPTGAGRAGLLVNSGAAYFDDLVATEIHWLAEDETHQIPWAPDEGSKWYRPVADSTSLKYADVVLVGKEGNLFAPAIKSSIVEVVIEEQDGAVGRCEVVGDGMFPIANSSPARRSFRRSFKGTNKNELTLAVAGKEVGVRRLALRLGEHLPEFEVIGPYHFTRSSIQDPSDYLDFTAEEYKQIRSSPDAQKLIRKAKNRALLGSARDENSLWRKASGQWHVQGGALVGRGPNAVLRHAQGILSDLVLTLKVKLKDVRSVAELDLFALGSSIVSVRLSSMAKDEPLAATGAPTPGNSSACINLQIPADEQFHDIQISVSGGDLYAQIDSQDRQRARIFRGLGGDIQFRVLNGSVCFDDIEFQVARKSVRGFAYAFKRTETDWWREGKGGGHWREHAGISCVLASNWISLLALKGKGMLWSKRTFGSDLMVAFNMEENTEWYGWRKHPSHRHFPYDNVQAVFCSQEDRGVGYRLVVSGAGRRATILYRNGKEVKRVRQDGKFPMRYTGGHAPYSPRKSRVLFSKKDGLLQVLINGKEVLRYQDEDPVEVSTVGLGGMDTRVNISNLEILNHE